MPIDKQVYRDFVATSNSGKYKTEEEVFSKFPELKNVDKQALRDFVATSNSGKYKTEDEIFSKFPEFGFEEVGVKKKESTSITPQQNVESKSESISLVTSKKPNSTIIKPDPKYKNSKEGSMSWNQEKIKQSNPEITNLFDQYKTAKSVSEEKKQDIVRSVDDEIEQKGFWNNTKLYAKKGFNATLDYLGQATGMSYLLGDGEVSDKLKLETKPLGEELKEVDKQHKEAISVAKKNNEPIPTFTEEQRLAKARELKIEKKVASQSESQVRSFLKKSESKVDSFKQSDKDKLHLFQQSELASLSEKDKVNLAEQNIQRLEINNLQNEVKHLISRAEKGEISQEEYIQQGTVLDTRYRTTIQEALVTYDKYVTNQKDIGDVKDNIDVMKRNYGWLKNFVDNAGATGADLTAGLINTGGWIDEVIGNDNPYLKNKTRQMAKVFTDIATDAREGIAKPIQVENINTLSDFGQWFSNTALASQVPIYAAVATGVGGIGALGVSATGTQWNEMQKDEDEGKADYNYWQKTFVPVGYGASETISAYVDRLVMLNSARIIRSATSPERSLIAKGMWEGIKNTSKEVVKNASYEGLDETATEIMQNMMDIYALDKKDVGVFDNVLDAAAAGAVMGALIPIGATVVSKAIKPFSVDSKLASINKEILSLEKALDSSTLTQIERSTIESQLQKAKVKNRVLLESHVSDISTMSNEEFDAIRRIERTQSNLREQAKEIGKGDLNQELKDQIISNLKEEFESVENQRIGILNRDSNALLNLLDPKEVIRLKDEAALELMQEKNPEGAKNITIDDKEISERALENHKKQSSQRDTDVPLSNEGVNETAQTEPITNQEENISEEKGVDETVYNPQDDLDFLASLDAEEKVEVETELNDSSLINEVVDNGKRYSFNGEEGIVTMDGQQVVFETNNTLHELGTLESLSDAKLLEFGIEEVKQLDITVNEDHSVNVEGKTFINPHDNYMDAIVVGKDGSYSINLENEKGQSRTIRGQRAEQIAYNYHLKNLENATEQEISAIERSTRDVIETSNEQTSGDTRKTPKRKTKKQRSLKKHKEPLSKSEREEIELNNLIEEEVKEKESRKIKLSDNGTDYYSEVDQKGKVSFVDEKGISPSETTHKKLALEYAKKIDLTEGKKAVASDNHYQSSKEVNKHIAENSNSPVEIAETIVSNEIENYRGDLDYKSRTIAENIGYLSRESFIQNSDENHIKNNGSIPIQYLRKDGASLDTKAKELSEITSIEITEQDIVDFILDNPTGAQTYLNNGFQADMNSLKSRFEEITGLPATNEVLQEVIRQNQIKEEFNKQKSSIDFMSEEELVNLSLERQQYETETYAAPYRVHENENRGNNGQKSRIQQEGSGKDKRAEDTTSVPNKSPQGELRKSDGNNSQIEEITFKLRESKRANTEKLEGFELEDFEKHFVLQYAKENDIWIEDIYSLGEPIPGGGNENSLIINENRDFYKVNNLFNTGFQVGKLLDQLEMHNKLFPETSYELIGFTGLDNGSKRAPLIEVILKQDFIEDATQASREEISNFMESLGFEKITDSSFKNKDYIVSDLHPRNVLKDSNGSILVIDDIIKVNTEFNLKSQKSGLDIFIENIDKTIDKLDQFGKENLGVNLPLVVARQALTAMKLAAQTTKVAADIVSAGLNAIKQTDWYKGLTAKEQKKINLSTVKNLISESVKAISKAESKIQDAKGVINDLKTKIKEKSISDKELYDQVISAINDNKLVGKLTPTETERLIKYATRIFTKGNEQGRAKAFETFANEYLKISERAKERGKTKKEKSSREIVESKIGKLLEEGKTEQEIIGSFDDRMEKMMAKDYFERQKEVDPKVAKQQVDESFERSRNKMEELTKPKFDINKLFRGFVTKFFDRQFLPKFLLNKAGGRVVRDYIVTAKGAAGYAKYMFEQASDKIYKGLTSDQINLLDKVIQLKRFIAIDENRRANDLSAVVHPDYINENVSKSYLESLQKELGDKVYNDLVKRADAYFDTFRGLLDQMQESGIISKESRDSFFDIDYQPRQFLEFMQNAETETAYLDNGPTTGLGKEQIQRLEGGLDTALVSDSRYLLAGALNIRAKTIAMNNTNKRLAYFMSEQQAKVEELKSKEKPTKKEKDLIKYFDQLQKRVKVNPITHFTDNGKPVYKYSSAPNGYANAYYWVDGVKHSLLMEKEFHEQYFDALKKMSHETKEKWAMRSGTGLVKSIATGNNPTFFITNTPRDFLFISTFSEEYGKNVLVNMAKLTKDAVLGIRDIKQENDTYQNFVKYGGMTDFLMDQGKFKNTQRVAEAFEKVGIGNKGRERWNKVISAVTLQKMQVYSEIGFRMGVFRRSIVNQLKELGLKDISEVESKQTLEDIYTTAASSARNTMDFNQGGTVTKDLDAFIPYLNAAAQGTRVMFDNFRDRPIETTLRVTQAAAFVAPIPIGLSLMFLGSSERGEDEKELSSTELYNKALKGVSKYDRSNYFIVFTGNRNANGEFEYYRIAKAQQLTPFFTLVEGTLQKVMRESVGDKESGTMIEDLNWILQNNISPVEFAVTDNLARNPLLKAALSMSTGYDFFREQDISPDRGKVPVAVEGFGSKSVEDFYKKIGETSGWSPARMKAAVESIITTPSTSPYVGMIYGGMDAMFSDKDTDVIMQKFAKDMAKSSVNRVVKETSEYNRRIGNKEKIKDAVEKIETDRLKLKLNFNTLVSDLKEGKITEKQLTDEINTLSKTEPFEAKRIANRVKDQLRNKNTPSFVFEVKYANTAKERAVLLADKFGDALLDSSKMEDKERLIVALLKKNSAINKETLVEYEKLVKN
ncbi:LPD38 domain-containing protein [Myroides odoratimimus]|uniref:putative polyvalent protein kinase domain-containing protein n=1 Tax=Myroides odoratimimus TaxID=76832 RepID=UPI00257710A0|nr:LPD38 domain-containing protein [Myroides odoratimimus]MDM1499071.1 hypothetical protein [Myroides odoratimimus]